MQKDVSTAYILRNIPELTYNQITQWVKAGWLTPMTGEGYSGNRRFLRSQFLKAKYMAYLIYRVGMNAAAASDVADCLIKEDAPVQRNRIWVNYNGTMLGVEKLEA